MRYCRVVKYYIVVSVEKINGIFVATNILQIEESHCFKEIFAVAEKIANVLYGGFDSVGACFVSDKCKQNYTAVIKRECFNKHFFVFGINPHFKAG